MSGQRKQRIITVLAVFLLILFLAGCSKPKEPRLLLSEESWHYGEVTPDQIVVHLFTLKNEGEEKLIIESVYSSCSCVTVELADKEIAAGKETKLKAIFDPSGYEGEVTKQIIIKSNDPENLEKRIDLTIIVQRVPNPDIELSQQNFDLGRLTRDTHPVLQFDISNTGDANLVIEEVISEEFFSHNLPLPLTIPPGDQFQAKVYLDTSQLKEGEFRKAIHIVTNDPQNSRIFLRISGIMRSNLEI